ncbi:MAG TPA: M81 family metallopeptidase [Isosphaeraceae bacterium]|nr:M81 family metallopeptidase [Isosphaeraceae bacterium]
MRIAIGGLMHESNTFAGSPTTLAAFEAGGLETGAGIEARWGQAHHEVGGFFEGATRFGFEPVPALMAWATPAGPLTAETYEMISARLIESLRACEPFDAVLLALHGAMVAEGEADADGATVARVRELVGPTRPLVVTLDFHGNVSPLLVESCNALVAYQTNPHVDQHARGLQAASLAARAASGQVRPTQALAKPPLLIPILAQDTNREPLRSLMAQLNQKPELLAASLLAGFPYADVAATGTSCVVVTDNDPALAQHEADALARQLWDKRKELTPTPPEAAAAVAQALACKATPVVLVDTGDNIGGGSAADSTVLLHELLRQGATGAIVALCDPDAVRACASAGVGAQVRVAAGGKIDHHAPPVTLDGQVRMLHDGRYVEDQVRHGGIRFNDQGLTAVVALAGDNTVVLTTLRHPPFSLGQLTSLGLTPQAARILVVKAAIAYKAA